MKQGWEVKKLGDVCIFERGLTYAKGDEVTVSSKGVLRSNNVDLSSNTLNFDEIKYLREDFEIPTKKKVKKNCLLMCMSNGSKIHLGKVALVDKDIDFAFGGFMGLLTPNEGIIHPKYLYYVLISPAYKLLIKNLSDGANINNLKFADLKSFNISVPSIEEQQRIVDILDKEFEKIDTLKANAEKGLQYAKDLIMSALKQELQPKEGWTTKTIEELSEDLFAGGDVPRESFSKTQNDDYNIPIYANAVENNGLYGYTNRARVVKPSITIAGRGSGTGYVIERNESYFPVVRLIVVIPNEFVLNKYLYYALKALNIKSNGSAIPQLTVPMIAQYKINFPKSLDEQNTIIYLLDRISEYCKTLQANYEKTIALCDDMKQALLRKAFNGGL